MRTSRKTCAILSSLALTIIIPLHYSSATIVPCALNDTTGGGSSDVCTLCHLIVGIYNVIGWIRSILVIAALAGITIGGVMYILSAGSPGMMQTAKRFITACVVGFALVLAAWLIIYLAMWLVSARTDLGIGKSNWYTFDCENASGQIDYSSGSSSSTSSDSEEVDGD